MNDYNSLIAAKILDGYDELLDTTAQPTMFGGKRMRNYVLPGSNEYNYPATLAVGSMDGRTAPTLGGEFYRDFQNGFPTRDAPRGAGRPLSDATAPHHGPIRRIGGRKPSFGKVMKSIGKELAPIAKDASKQLVKEGIKEGVSAMAHGGKMPKFLKQVGREVAPIARDAGKQLVKEGIKSALSPSAEGGRRKKSLLKSIGKKHVLSMTRELGKMGKTFMRDVIVPEGKDALRDYVRGSLRAPAHAEAEYEDVPMAEVHVAKKGKGRSGGVLIRNHQQEFEQSVYPPALTSYTAGKDAYGRGRDKPKRTNPRGAIVSKVMKELGLSLADASRYVKEHDLY